MNTLLRVLVIVITLLGAVALVLATMNFSKRQILLGRNQALVEHATSLAKTVEAQDAKNDGSIELTLMKDISEVTDRVLENPDKEAVFENYPVWLETQNLPTLSFSTDEKQEQLNRLYALDENGKIKLGPSGLKVTKGPGTMQDLLEQLVTRSSAQRTTLDKTRAELNKMRELVTKNVEELNKLKGGARIVRRDLTTAKGEIVQLEGEKTTLEGRVAKLTSDKRELEAQVVDMSNQVETLQEREVALTEDLAKATARIKELSEIRGPRPPPLRGEGEITTGVALTAGDKGKVIESNDEYKFAIIEFSPDAMMEILGAEREKPLPQVDMGVRRLGRSSAANDFVTKIKLRHPVKGKNLVVADILTDWQQTPVEKGDVVYF